MNTLTLTSSKQNFIRGVMSGAATADSSLSPQTRALLASWAALESGWGKTKQAKLGFNLWNVSKGGWTGPVISGGDTEYVAGQKGAKHITQLRRHNGSIAESVTDLLKLLRNSRYHPRK